MSDHLTSIIAKQIEDELLATLLGGPPRKQPQTALRLRGRRIETVELDDAGNMRRTANFG